MPTISRFDGITITMYWDEGHHHAPHFHAYYGEHEVSLDFNGRILAGTMPKRQLRRVRAWAKRHPDELNTNWELVLAEKPLNPIDPLR